MRELLEISLCTQFNSNRAQTLWKVASQYDLTPLKKLASFGLISQCDHVFPIRANFWDSLSVYTMLLY